MKVAIFDCVSPDALTEKYGPTAGHVERWLAPALPEAAFTRIDLPGGDQPPAPEAFDAYVISGSEKGVYDETPWMVPLKRFLQDAAAAGRPVFGICFGHQILAEAHGGRAEKVSTGFAAGVRSFEMGGGEVNAYVAHQDQVTATPPGARVLASAPYCPVAALAYDLPALSVQFHPEYNEGFARDLLDMFGPQILTPDQEAKARTTLGEPVVADLFAKTAADFLRGRAAL